MISKKFLLVNLAVVVVLYVASTDAQQPAPLVKEPELRQELLKRGAEDQAIRNELIKKGSAHPDPELMKRMQEIDASNTARAKAIVSQYGWPGPNIVGNDGMEAFFLLVQHADHEFQKQILPVVQKAFLNGETTGQNFALLTDRVLVGDGKPQMFGTQAKPFDKWEGKEPVLEPIQDEANVDKRRAELGMMTLAEYKAFLKELYFPETKSKP